MITIEISKSRFLAFHGLYAEEKATGNEFEVNVRVLHKTSKKKIKSLKDTLDYVLLYRLVQEEMKKPRQLLETLAIEMAERIKSDFPQVKEVDISITKLNPPILNFTGSVTVTYNKSY